MYASSEYARACLEFRHRGCRSPVAIDDGQVGTGLAVAQVVLGNAAVPGGVTFVGHRQRQAADTVSVLRIVPLAALVDRDVVLGPADRRRSIARYDTLKAGRLTGNDRNVLQGGNKQGLLGGDGRFLGVLRCAGCRAGATHGGATGRRVVWSGAP